MSRNNDDIFTLRSLANERERTRQNFKQGFSTTKENIRPSNLINRFKNNMRLQVEETGKKAVNTVKSHPGKAASIFTVMALAVFYKPIGKLIDNIKSARTTADNFDTQE